MDRLIQDILTYSRVARAELDLEPVEVKRLLRDILETYPVFQSSGAVIAFEEPLPWVLGNEAILTQCFSNLLANAVKFVEQGVTPQVRIWAEPAPDSHLVKVLFKDNGVGISEESRGKLFGIFQRLTDRYEGTGIGLAIVKKGAERMGGRVGFESTPGSGSTFWLELKLSRPV